MKRLLTLSQFRNFGIDSEDEFLLNFSQEKGKMGDLILVIGPNNSGKSNLIDALNIMGGHASLKYNRDSSSEIFVENSGEEIKLSLSYSNDKISITKIMSLDSSDQLHVTYKCNDKLECIEKFIQNNPSVDEFKTFLQKYGNYSSYTRNLINELNLELPYQDLIVEFIIKYKKYKQMYPNNSYIDVHISSDLFSLINEYFALVEMPFSIKKYVENSISNKQLTSTYDELFASETLIFKLIKNLGYSKETIQGYIDKFKKSNNKCYCEKLETLLNSKMIQINNHFNKLYFLENEKYDFHFSVESERIFLSIKVGDQPVNLDYQSVGFKWFFNFYFNFICLTTLSKGDIILFDEPATNLHPSGISELRKVMKDFAVKNDLTFIVTTHSPFFVDVDNLDELRVITNNGGKAKIENHFSTINDSDTDSLKEVKNALTVKTHILYDPDKRNVFVEGITDYNYLTLFKRLFNNDKLYFVPFNGVGNNDQARHNTIKSLINLKIHNSIILVDGDTPGKLFLKLTEGTMFKGSMSISEMNEKFKEIEDLFSEKDKKKFMFISKTTKQNRIDNSAIMKRTASLKDFSEETIQNFKNLFEKLQIN